ncbi:MAG: rRNA pseudouridine synthase [Chloroflexi bacterium]|nr:rRNA pseudouridine synthase [Chloroflexota bacterium]
MSARHDKTRGERLQKVMACVGIASRRKCETYILAGRVKVNGQVITELGTRVDPATDRIEVDGRPLRIDRERRYYLLYKPVGHLSTAHDPFGRPTVIDLLPMEQGSAEGCRLYPVGRLDKDSEGLLLLTDDGELAERLLHPRYKHEKEYLVLVQGQVSPKDARRLEAGLSLAGERRPARAQVVSPLPEGWRWRGQPAPEGRQWVRFILVEGRKRQIRRMLEALGYRAERLVRVRMANLHLGNLRPGQGRWLRDDEIRELRRAVGLLAQNGDRTKPNDNVKEDALDRYVRPRPSFGQRKAK